MSRVCYVPEFFLQIFDAILIHDIYRERTENGNFRELTNQRAVFWHETDSENG